MSPLKTTFRSLISQWLGARIRITGGVRIALNLGTRIVVELGSPPPLAEVVVPAKARLPK